MGCSDREDRKADPDEKGTESSRFQGYHSEHLLDRKADPDEKGTESRTRSWIRPLARS